MTNIQKFVVDFFALNLEKASRSGWMLSEKSCPWCGKNNKHFSVKLNHERKGQYKNHVVTNCLKCQETASDFKLLTKIGAEHLLDEISYIKQSPTMKLDNKIKNFRETKKTKLDLSVETQRPPLGYRRLYKDDYLESRGFESWQYELYNVGRAKMVSSLRDYILILIEDNGENKGYIARHSWGKEEIKEYEQRTGIRVLRYANQKGIEFDKLLFGIDEVNKDTHTVILVEGVFDKTNVDKQLELNLQDGIKCCCTFGKKLGAYQIEKLKLKGIRNIILLYDNDAVNESKVYSDMLKMAFKKVKVCFIHPDCKEDAGDFDYETLMDLIENAQDPINFQLSKLQKRNLVK
jgi:DNA primase